VVARTERSRFISTESLQAHSLSSSVFTKGSNRRRNLPSQDVAHAGQSSAHNSSSIDASAVQKKVLRTFRSVAASMAPNSSSPTAIFRLSGRTPSSSSHRKSKAMARCGDKVEPPSSYDDGHLVPGGHGGNGPCARRTRPLISAGTVTAVTRDRVFLWEHPVFCLWATYRVLWRQPRAYTLSFRTCFTKKS